MIQSIDCSFIARADALEGGRKAISSPKKIAAFPRESEGRLSRTGLFQQPADANSVSEGKKQVNIICNNFYCMI
jgi:hypothetical protein